MRQTLSRKSQFFPLDEIKEKNVQITDNIHLDSFSDIRNSIGRDHDCLACIISSHGAEIPLSRQLNQDQKLRQHVIYTKNAFLPTEEILQEFDDDHCKNLAGKPKMFFIQVGKNEDVLHFYWCIIILKSFLLS